MCGCPVRRTNGTILNLKCDILFVPDVVLGAGEAMRRREFIAFVGSAAAAWPLMARAQQVADVWRVGWLADAPRQIDEIFRQSLRELGYIEGSNLITIYRYA